MGVKKAGRRKLIHDNQLYIWYVSLDDDSPYYILHIISENKELILAVPLGLEFDYVISKGKIFQGQDVRESWKRFQCPLHIPEIITPKFVAEIIAWAVGDDNGVEIHWDGKKIIV